MAKKVERTGIDKATAAMVIFAILGAIVVGGQFEVIKVWPRPISVEPYFGWSVASIWGLVVGGVCGYILGFLTDDRHFRRDE